MSHRPGGRRPGNGILRVAWDGGGTMAAVAEETELMMDGLIGGLP
jgi:hypothetical protein